MRIGIIGGGIGGLSLALALERRGLEVEVYESAPELRPVGAGIWVPTNAMQVFERLGVSEAIAAEGLPLERIELHDTSAGPLQTVDLGPIRERFGHTTISIARTRLQKILAGALDEGVLRLGHPFTGFSDDGRRVVARFEEGAETEVDALVGADGINSTVRRQLFPGSTLRYSGQTCYVGFSDLELDPAIVQTCRETWGGAVRFGFSAVEPGRVYWFAPVTAEAGGEDAPGTIARTLVDRYAAFPEPIPEILCRADESSIVRIDLNDLAPLDAWSSGRVGLVGDAAHATTPNLGQGGAQAIEDAWVLAECLSRIQDPAAAFVEFERIRGPKARYVVAQSRQLGWLAHLENRFARALRNVAVRATPRSVQRRQIEERLYRVDYLE